jgi:hypothetical protein
MLHRPDTVSVILPQVLSNLLLKYYLLVLVASVVLLTHPPLCMCPYLQESYSTKAGADRFNRAGHPDSK